MAIVESEQGGLGPRKSMFVLVIVVGCFAVLWPRILSPMFTSRDHMRPNHHDKAAGCCDLVVETDINAFAIMAEVCGNIMRRDGRPLEARFQTAFRTGKLTPDIISICRQEVNMTCGIDISSFLDHNVRLGKTYKQILDDVRSYNSSNCLKMNYGVVPATLGMPHFVGKFWVQDVNTKSLRQERPPHLRPPPLHPALRERGRAMGAPPMVAAVPSPPQMAPPGATPQGRVWSPPLNVYLAKQQEEMFPAGGMRPPMGGAGGVVQPPKSSVGFLMPLYTICIVMFFLYTVLKMVFRKSTPAGEEQAELEPDPRFREQVFNKGSSRSNRSTPDSNKLVVSAISGLVAEVRQQMDDSQPTNHSTVAQDPPRPYTNGSVHHYPEDTSSIYSRSTDLSSSFRDDTPPSWEVERPNLISNDALLSDNNLQEFNTTQEDTLPSKDTQKDIIEDFLTSERTSDTVTPEIGSAEPSKEAETPKVDTERLGNLEAKRNEAETPKVESCVANQNDAIPVGERATLRKEISPPLYIDEYESDEEEEVVASDEDDDRAVIDDALARQLRNSIEREKATVKVMGMEMTAHCEGNRRWGARPATPPAPFVPPPPQAPPPQAPQHPSPSADEVSSIYLQGALPHQSRLLVAESETHTEKMSNGDDKDPPIVLSGKMTLSVINDESAKTTPERDNAVVEEPTNMDEEDEFTTASAFTAPKQPGDESEEEEEIEEEVEEEVEVEEVEVEEEEEEEV